MQIVEFYRDERGNQNGHTRKQILLWSDPVLDMDHDFVQWLFPSNEQSKMNDEAPTLTKEESEIFCKDPELQENVKESFIRFLKFLQFKMVSDDGMVQIEPLNDEPIWWLKEFNHTMLRVTRLLKSLRLTGLDRYSVGLYNALCNYKKDVSPNTWKHWNNAVFEPLWSK